MQANQLPDPQELLARRRAALLVQVQCSQITATEAAAQLGIARKSYYQWERRALAALLAAMRERPQGRRTTPRDPQKEQLQRQVQQLQEQVRELEREVALCHQLKELDPSKKNS
jgi:transcription initiation factor TFIID subunit TAF12